MARPFDASFLAWDPNGTGTSIMARDPRASIESAAMERSIVGGFDFLNSHFQKFAFCEEQKFFIPILDTTDLLIRCRRALHHPRDGCEGQMASWRDRKT